MSERQWLIPVSFSYFLSVNFYVKKYKTEKRIIAFFTTDHGRCALSCHMAVGLPLLVALGVRCQAVRIFFRISRPPSRTVVGLHCTAILCRWRRLLRASCPTSTWTIFTPPWLTRAVCVSCRQVLAFART
ncbi:hypothetical protein TW95_gp0904 [Pandoravirus inopinatum]|uniref:Uncharacterized protein n=1 Tax=Pandoravirus inopinatum TaxID=1605721 RepID=A0A0B5IXW3_9VIRU|nr:hypothetical protein TW95_gp0904 [Pandoravirus inopinatum]AJF97638.1 hypothetical protein [Pandoravirus inopinatum]